MSAWKWTKKKKKKDKKDVKIPHETLRKQEEKEMNSSLDETIQFVEGIIGDSDDFSIREFSIFGKYPAAMCYISNLVDQTVINNDLLRPLMSPPDHVTKKDLKEKQLPQVLSDEVLYHHKVLIEANLAKLIEAILLGDTVIIIDGVPQALHIGTRDIEKRAITQPETEQVVIGPREGFIENLGVNLGLLRYRLPTPDFRVKTLNVGRLTKSKVAICYLKGTANQAIVDEVESRIRKINIDAVLDVGYIEQFIEDHHLSPFPQTQITERPDAAVGNILEGRVAVIVDGSPFALLVPVVFNQFYQTTEDYSSRVVLGSFVRLIRILALVFSLVFPSLYVSVISFNPELLPTEFAVAVSGGRAGVPFPAVIEVLIIEIAMEVLREATVRLPNQVGGALSIVGVLVIGQAAVDAGLASPITIVIIALTTIGSFATPIYAGSSALRILRFPTVILAGVFGLYGVMVGIIIIFNHMLSLRSFGVPYMSPVSPGNGQGMKDVTIRSPLWWMPQRPSFLHTPNETRLGENDNLLKTAPHNTLGQTKVGNERWEGEEDGVSTPNNSRSDGGNSD